MKGQGCKEMDGEKEHGTLNTLLEWTQLRYKLTISAA